MHNHSPHQHPNYLSNKNPLPLHSLSWSNATSKVGKSDTSHSVSFQAGVAHYKYMKLKNYSPKMNPKTLNKVIWDSFVVGFFNSGPTTRKNVFSIKKARLTENPKLWSFAHKILNLVDLPNQILLKILVALFFFHVWAIS
jgi:hypothetical protein